MWWTVSPREMITIYRHSSLEHVQSSAYSNGSMNLDKIVGHKIFRNARLLSLKFIGTIIGEDVMHILSTTHDVRMCITISILLGE